MCGVFLLSAESYQLQEHRITVNEEAIRCVQLRSSRLVLFMFKYLRFRLYKTKGNIHYNKAAGPYEIEDFEMRLYFQWFCCYRF